MKKFLKELICHLLPDVKEKSASKIAQYLKQLGVTKISDLSSVEEKDLSTHLSQNQSKELMHALQKIGSNRFIFGENEQPKKLTEIQARRITKALSNMKKWSSNDSFSASSIGPIRSDRSSHSSHVSADRYRINNNTPLFVDDPLITLEDPEQMVVNHLNQKTYEKHLSSNNAYDIDWDNSRALLINILKNRDYASIDSRRLKTILPQLGFQKSNVIVKEDITCKEILQCIEEFLSAIVSSQKAKQKKALALLYIGSHGGRDESNVDFFEDVNGKEVFFCDLIDLFKDPKYQAALAGNPKVFWFQFAETRCP